MSTVGYKTLANIAVPPDGERTVIYRPEHQAVITNLVITTFWDNPKQAGYAPDDWKSRSDTTVKFSNGSKRYTGFPAQSPEIYLQSGYQRISYHIIPGSNNGEITFMRGSAGNQDGFYSLFQLLVDGTPLTSTFGAPEHQKSYTFPGPITLDATQPLEIINGIVIANIEGIGASAVQKLAQDHRARANHLQVLVFGQEITS